MYELIAGLNKQDTTIIMISHDMEASIKYASHILHIGTSIFFGTKDDYIHSGAGAHFLEGNGTEVAQ